MITQEVRKNWSHRAAALVLAMGFGMMIGLAPESPRADQSVPMMTVGFSSGTITAIYETTFQIDHRTYSLTPDAVLLDRHGDELKVSDLRVTIDVKYHLEKGSTDKIDRMILYLPE